jgi:hypothetical protein
MFDLVMLTRMCLLTEYQGLCCSAWQIAFTFYSVLTDVCEGGLFSTVPVILHCNNHS